MRKTLLIIGTTLTTIGFMTNVHAAEGPQGLYSADAILDANAYQSSNQQERVGDVEDILLDDDMRVQALVIETGATLGMGGREIVVNNDHYRLETSSENAGDTEHRVIIDATADELEQMPEYNASWWNETRQQAREAWEATQEGAESAWQRTREGAEQAADTIEESIRGNE
ncbi:hypothetical protein L861_16150 [Litchfieldella anticariensis FP35 = DSM 16096]|uniref:Uncharacterized protein n=1 Tax=Litchfieldella anticariensis (strain DSM 16096 / CECT 5854 / CIP 108499 / LMG 22089 / FP35) TaxID=1121939 RepID=S2KJV5_LITA3|nr:PRC-barrel domain-containing protein [Halomonas anticariensis]EPC02240.1 hypothetical protein L861_16150 [Halomonas anticariensis FP35 = DSM 16096]